MAKDELVKYRIGSSKGLTTLMEQLIQLHVMNYHRSHTDTRLNDK